MQLDGTIRLDAHTQQVIDEGGDLFRPAVIAGLDLTVQTVEAVVVEHTPIDQGTLRASIVGRVLDQWPTIEGQVSSPLAYAEPVEAGSKPHWPPISPIQAWVRRTFGVSGKEMVSIAFLVARAIAKGTGRNAELRLRGQRMFAKGLETGERVGPQFIAQAVQRVEDSLSDR